MTRSRWNELLSVPEEIRNPNLYQLLGLDEHAFSLERVEPAFRERMQRVQSLRSTKHKEFLEFVKGELRRALRILTSQDERRLYDADLRAERSAELRRILVPTLAAGVLVSAAEKALLASAVLDLGMSEPEALAVIDAELERSGAVRVDAPTLGAIPQSERLTLDAWAALSKQQAEILADLARAAALRAAEARRLSESSVVLAELAPSPKGAKRLAESSIIMAELAPAPPKPAPSKTPSRSAPVPTPLELEPLEEIPHTDSFPLPVGAKKKPAAKTAKPTKKKKAKSGAVKVLKVKGTPPVLEPLPPMPMLATVKFCAACGVTIPERWQKTGEAERVGARLLCSACTAPIRAGKACAACSKALAPGEPVQSAGGAKRICMKCAQGAQRLKVCSSCQVILPKVALERGEVVERDGKYLCKDCAAR